MLINSHENQQNVKLDIDRTETVKHFEYSGMHIDKMLSMGKQVESILKKARCKIGILLRNIIFNVQGDDPSSFGIWRLLLI